MNTTSLFVELIIIGIGATVWVLLLFMACFSDKEVVASLTSLLAAIKRENIDTGILMLLSAVPIFSIVYVLGIIADRLANKIFDVIGDRLKKKHFPVSQDFLAARHSILTGGEYLKLRLEYGRSRLRICRGWALNFAMTGIVLLCFLPAKLALAGTIFCVIMTVATGWGWYEFIVTEYKKLKEESKYLKSLPSPNNEKSKQ